MPPNLKNEKSWVRCQKKMPALENYDMLIKYILLWIWSVFEIFKTLQFLEREKSQCSTFLKVLWEITLSPWCYRYFILHGCPLNGKPTETENSSTVSHPQSSISLRKSTTLLGKEPTGKPSELFVSSFSLPHARKQSWLLTASEKGVLVELRNLECAIWSIQKEDMEEKEGS